MQAVAKDKGREGTGDLRITSDPSMHLSVGGLVVGK